MSPPQQPPPPLPTERIRTDAVLAELVDVLGSLTTGGYEGGLSSTDIELATSLGNHALEHGVPKIKCELKPQYGSILSSGDPSETSGRTDHNLTLDVLEHFIRMGNRKQQAVALVAVTLIGPGASFSPAFLQNRGSWAGEALSALTCKRWSSADAFHMWSSSKIDLLNGLNFKEAAKRGIDFMIEQMLNKELEYPEGVFSHTLSNRPYGRYLSVSAVRQLLPVLRDDTYGESIQLEAAEFVRVLGRTTWGFNPDKGQDRDGPILVRRLRGHEHVFEDDLLRLYRDASPRLAEAAGSALVDVRSRHGAEVLADVIESGRYDHWAWAVSSDCEAFTNSERLGRLLIERVRAPVEVDRITAIKAIGCINLTAGVTPLLEALDAPFWSQQEAVVQALGKCKTLPPDALAAVERMSTQHWSSNVRKAAAKALTVLKGQAKREAEDIFSMSRLGFHRKAIKHGIPRCHGETAGNGLYSLPGRKAFLVNWTVAKVHDLPKGFPVKLDEMRERKGYGTNTFLRQVDGWLYSTDLWHYDGVFGFVTDKGHIQAFAPKSAHAAFIVNTQFGITALGHDILGGGDGGVLAVLSRDPGGNWHWETVLETPSEAYGYAFAPDGTLLVRDPFGAVAITKDKVLLPLNCMWGRHRLSRAR